MTELTKYQCDVCGAVYNTEDECERCEFTHKMEKLYEHAKFFLYGCAIEFDENYSRIDDFLNSIDGIICDDKATAEAINQIWDNEGYPQPFYIDITKDTFYKRVYNDPNVGYWRDADNVISEIEEIFGK